MNTRALCVLGVIVGVFSQGRRTRIAWRRTRMWPWEAEVGRMRSFVDSMLWLS